MKNKGKYFLVATGILTLLFLSTTHSPTWVKNGNPGANSCSSVKLEIMSPDTLRSLDSSDRLRWYKNKVLPCKNEFKKSADRHKIPPELLAAIILNELVDIDLFDLIQEWTGVGKGSVGIAQIQIDTAIFHHLVDVIEDEIENYRNSPEAAHRFGKEKPSKEQIRRIVTGEKLIQPEIAIEAAAREIRKILENIEACSRRRWRDNFLKKEIKLANRNPDQIYDLLKGETQREKSVNLARMVAAPYNSSGMECVENPGNPFSPNDGGPFANPRKRSESAAFIAEDLFNGDLFKE